MQIVPWVHKIEQRNKRTVTNITREKLGNGRWGSMEEYLEWEVHICVKKSDTLIKEEQHCQLGRALQEKSRGFAPPFNLLLLFYVTAEGLLISLSFASLPPFSILLVKFQGGFYLSPWAETHPSQWAVSVKHNLSGYCVSDELRLCLCRPAKEIWFLFIFFNLFHSRGYVNFFISWSMLTVLGTQPTLSQAVKLQTLDCDSNHGWCLQHPPQICLDRCFLPPAS